MSSPIAPPPVSPQPTSQDQNFWAMLCHLSAFASFVFPSGGNILGPLIVWLIKKDQMPLVDDQGKESLNFQISMTIYLVVTVMAIFILMPVFLIGLLFTPLVPAIVIFDIVMTIVAAVKANQGMAYRYPLTIRFLK